MNDKREILDYIEDSIKAIENIDKFVKGLDFNDFVNDEKTFLAVVRALEILGEAAKKIPDEIRDQYSEIQWKEMSGMRDKLIHEYFGVDADVIWKTIKEDLPKTKIILEKILKEKN